MKARISEISKVGNRIKKKLESADENFCNYNCLLHEVLALTYLIDKLDSEVMFDASGVITDEVKA